MYRRGPRLIRRLALCPHHHHTHPDIVHTTQSVVCPCHDMEWMGTMCQVAAATCHSGGLHDDSRAEMKVYVARSGRILFVYTSTVSSRWPPEKSLPLWSCVRRALPILTSRPESQLNQYCIQDFARGRCTRGTSCRFRFACVLLASNFTIRLNSSTAIFRRLVILLMPALAHVPTTGEVTTLLVLTRSKQCLE